MITETLLQKTSSNLALPTTLLINLHGLTIQCTAKNQALVLELVRPFKYFLVDQSEKVDTVIHIEEIAPDYASFPTIPSSFSTPRNIIYLSPTEKIIDYFGKGVVVEKKEQSDFTIYSEDLNFLREAYYLLVVSLFGQYCDQEKMMRIHALALSFRDTAILLPMPPGSGKSTMAMALLQRDGFKLISDDEPILKRDGRLYPFPLRIGTLDKEKIKTIPEKFVYQIDRMEFGNKYFIDYDYWADRLESRALKRSILFVAIRMLNGAAVIEKTSKTKAMKVMIRDAVVGIGLYQGVEFVFNHSPMEILKKFGLAWRRFWLAWTLVRQADIYEITLSRDTAENVSVLEKFLKEKLG